MMRAVSFLVGVFQVWVALDSPLADHHLLTVHMIQHVLLMTVAPPLILLSEPFEAIWQALPSSGQTVVGRLFQLAFVERAGRILSKPTLCWTVSTLTLVGWHVPALLKMTLESDVWHSVAQLSFLSAGFLFWWPVVRPWPALRTGPQWSTLLYLFLATLPCDVLAGFLAFSDRVVYPMYLSMPRHGGLSVLEDQQRAAALMWACVTLIYLVPAAILSTRLLSPRSA